MYARMCLCMGYIQAWLFSKHFPGPSFTPDPVSCLVHSQSHSLSSPGSVLAPIPTQPLQYIALVNISDCLVFCYRQGCHRPNSFRRHK
jgi:hypothetical protein